MRQRRTQHRDSRRCRTSFTAGADGNGLQSDLPESVIRAMNVALADERNALATYRAVIKRFVPVRPFVNIAQSEERHIGALLGLYATYGVDDPGETATIDPAVESADVEAICELSVQGEVENVRLYDDELLPAVADYPDILAVMTNLRDASALRHKPAFKRCAERYAISLRPSRSLAEQESSLMNHPDVPKVCEAVGVFQSEQDLHAAIPPIAMFSGWESASQYPRPDRRRCLSACPKRVS